MFLSKSMWWLFSFRVKWGTLLTDSTYTEYWVSWVWLPIYNYPFTLCLLWYHWTVPVLKAMEMPQWNCNVGFVMFVFFYFDYFNMQRHDDLLRDSESIDGQEFAKQPPLSSWCQRQIEVQQCWQQARPQNIANLLSAENIFQMTCKHHVIMWEKPLSVVGNACPQSGFVQSVINWYTNTILCTVGKPSWMAFTNTFLQQFIKYHDNKYIICEQGWCLSFFKLFAFIYLFCPNKQHYKIIITFPSTCSQSKHSLMLFWLSFALADCLLPTAFPQMICSCDTGDVAISVGKSIILVCINVRTV